MYFFLAAIFACLVRSQIIINGDFETNDCLMTLRVFMIISPFRTYCACSACSMIAPWEVTGSIDVVSSSYFNTFGSSLWSLDMNGMSSGTIVQNITTKVN